MPLDLLDTPLRATWTLSADGKVPDSSIVQTIAQQLSEAGVFYLLLQAPSLIHPDCSSALDVLSSSGCQVQAVCRGSEQELSILDSRPKLIHIWLDVAAFIVDESVDMVRLQSVLDRLRRLSFDPGLLLVPERRHILKIPQLITICCELNIERFKLPNIGIDVNFQHSMSDQLARAEDVAKLKSALGPDFHIPTGLRLEVHDLFLWELLVPNAVEGREEYGGCQAANSLAHITPQGDVYPCISWPEKLGSLLTDELIDIWESEGRLRVRSEIANVPSGCKGCAILDDCFGGCRGLSRIFNREQEQRDMLCSGKR